MIQASTQDVILITDPKTLSIPITENTERIVWECVMEIEL
jgi:hypothetical protein